MFSCLLLAFGVVLVVGTLLDIFTSLGQSETQYSAGLQSTGTEDDEDRDSLIINSQQPVIFNQTYDLPLILGTSRRKPCCQRTCGN